MNAYRTIELADGPATEIQTSSGFFRCQDCGRDTRNVQIHECEESDIRRRERRRPRSAKEDMTAMIRRHGAQGSILALSEALRDLGPEWCGDAGAAAGIEIVTGYAPHRTDDYRTTAGPRAPAPTCDCGGFVDHYGAFVHAEACENP